MDSAELKLYSAIALTMERLVSAQQYGDVQTERAALGVLKWTADYYLVSDSLKSVEIVAAGGSRARFAISLNLALESGQEIAHRAVISPCLIQGIKISALSIGGDFDTKNRVENLLWSRLTQSVHVSSFDLYGAS